MGVGRGREREEGVERGRRKVRVSIEGGAIGRRELELLVGFSPQFSGEENTLYIPLL